MKLRLSILLLAAAALAAAPAAGQTIKSLGYNTTNGQVVYSGSNSLTFTNALQFSTNARATTRTNLGATTLGNAVFTATNIAAAQVAIFGTNAEINTSGGLVGLTLSTNETKLLNAISFPFLGGATAAATSRTNLGLGGSDSVTFSNLSLSGNGSLAIGGMNVTAITSGIDLAFKRAGSTELELKTNGLILHVGSYDFSGGNTNGVSTTRTNLGLGGTNTVTFSNIQLNSFPSGSSTGFVGRNGAQLSLYGTNVSTSVPAFYGYDGFNNTAFSAATARTNLELGATNNVTFSNVTATGSLTATGNATLNGTGNLAPSQTASSASSLMTRDLTDINPLWAVHSIRTVGAYLFGNSGTSSVAVESGTVGGAQVNSGTSTNGYGRATLSRGITTASGITGAGINFARDISFGGLALFNPFDSSHAIRLIFGGNGGVPAPADSNALTSRGFGVEFLYSTNQVKARLFANDGTNYTTSALTTFNHSSLAMSAFVVRSDGTGNVSLYIDSSSSVAPRPPANATVSITGGPTSSSGAGQYIDFVAVGSSTGTNTGGSAAFFNGYIQVK